MTRRLVPLTRRGVGVTATEPVDPAMAAVGGLVRSAQAENPDGIVLVDLDEDPASVAALPAAVACGAPHVAVRAGALYTPTLTVLPTAGDGVPAWPADGTVLVTGGTGALGAIVARHLVARHGVPSLLLLSRRGPEAQGAAELADELTGLGAAVRIVAGDAADPAALAAALAAVPGEYPLRGVVHAAGVVHDSVVSRLDG